MSDGGWQAAANNNPNDRVRVWWIPQIPMTAFRVTVADIDTAIRVCQILAAYDFFQYEERVKPDFSNAGGLEVLGPDGEWEQFDYENEDEIEEARTLAATQA